MQKDLINREAELLLETITEQYHQINSHADRIPQIELDLILVNIAKLYEQMLFLKKSNQREANENRPVSDHVTVPESIPVHFKPLPEAEPSVSAQGNEKPPVVSFLVNPSLTPESTEASPLPLSLPEEPEKEMNESFTINTANVNGPEKISKAETKTFVADELPGNSGLEENRAPVVSSKRTSVQTPGLFDGIQTVADKYEEHPTLHDKISRNKIDSSLGRKLQNKPVEDLKKSIGINEKFSFINELFEGDLNNYNKAIDMLNKSASLEDAIRYIEEQLQPQYDWKRGSKSFISLSELIERRFMK